MDSRKKSKYLLVSETNFRPKLWTKLQIKEKQRSRMRQNDILQGRWQIFGVH